MQGRRLLVSQIEDIHKLKEKMSFTRKVMKPSFFFFSLCLSYIYFPPFLELYCGCPPSPMIHRISKLSSNKRQQETDKGTGIDSRPSVFERSNTVCIVVIPRSCRNQLCLVGCHLHIQYGIVHILKYI
jgi:hypothetical protein